MLLSDPDAPSSLRVKVLDFGIAKLRPEHMSQEMTIVRTQSGQLLGTPNYMAPEQCQSNLPQTDKVDVYALGTVMYRCLAGRTPFITNARGDAGVMHLCAQQIGEPVPPLRGFARDIPEEMATFVELLLSKDSTQRPSMREVAVRLLDLKQRGVTEVASGGGPRDSSEDLATLSMPSDALTTPMPQPPSQPGYSLSGGGPTARVRARKNKLPWYYVAGGLFVLAWLAVLAWWALAGT